MVGESTCIYICQTPELVYMYMYMQIPCTCTNTVYTNLLLMTRVNNSCLSKHARAHSPLYTATEYGDINYNNNNNNNSIITV